MNKQYVYLFEEGNKDMRDLLGGKGANLAEMTRIGLPVPPGMTITTEACKDYYDQGGDLSSEVLEQVWTKLADVEQAAGKTFGNAKNPLLVSVRSGAVISMPGMMDTVLNLGLNDQTIEGLIDRTQDERFAWIATAALFRCIATWLWKLSIFSSIISWSVKSRENANL